MKSNIIVASLSAILAVSTLQSARAGAPLKEQVIAEASAAFCGSSVDLIAAVDAAQVLHEIRTRETRVRDPQLKRATLSAMASKDGATIMSVRDLQDTLASAALGSGTPVITLKTPNGQISPRHGGLIKIVYLHDLTIRGGVLVTQKIYSSSWVRLSRESNKWVLDLWLGKDSKGKDRYKRVNQLNFIGNFQKIHGRQVAVGIKEITGSME